MSNNREWPEKELEDYIFANPQLLFTVAPDHLRVIGRQVKCGTGVIDLLLCDKHQLFVAELKAVTATDETVGQVTRYKETLEYCLEGALNRHATDNQKRDILYPGRLNALPVYCFIVAPAFTKQAVLTCGHIGKAIIAQKTQDREFSLTDAIWTGIDRHADEELQVVLKDFCIGLLTREEQALGRRVRN